MLRPEESGRLEIKLNFPKKMFRKLAANLFTYLISTDNLQNLVVR